MPSLHGTSALDTLLVKLLENRVYLMALDHHNPWHSFIDKGNA
jgi:hypothetical protein